MRRLLPRRKQRITSRPPSADQEESSAERPIPTVTFVRLFPDHTEEAQFATVEELLPKLSEPGPCWIDIRGDHPVETFQKLAEGVGLHALTLEDILTQDQRPKVEEFPGYMYIVLQKPTYRAEQKRLEVEQVSLLLTDRYVISIHEHALDSFSPIHTRITQERKRICRLGTDYLGYCILDSTVDNYFIAVEHYEDKIEELEHTLPLGPRRETIEQLYQMRQEILLMRRSVWPLREVINTLSKMESPLFDEGIKVYLKDLQDHIFQIIEMAEVYREMVTGLQNIYLSTVSNQMNEVMKTLTMIASIFIPLTLVTGIYGMNFTDMPELHWTYGYPMAIGIMLFVALAMLFYFRRRKWI